MPVLERSGKPALHYEVDDATDPWRDAPVMILQHGYGRSSRFWYHWVPYLSRFYRVVRPDLRGHGRTQTDPARFGELRAADFVGDLVDLVDALGGGRVHYCGESFAGILGMALAAEHPGRLRTLTLVSAPLTISTSLRDAWNCGFVSLREALERLGPVEWARRTNASTRFPPGTDPRLIEWYANEMAKTPPEVLIRFFELICGSSAAPWLERVSTPMLGLYPSGGRITGPDEAAIRRIIADKGMRYVTFPTEFHSIQFMLPAACSTHLLHFAAQHDGVACRE
jgi:3-oxoadipate enol-lactonase